MLYSLNRFVRKRNVRSQINSSTCYHPAILRVDCIMAPIEQVQVGTLVFLECGCSAIRWISHPTGAAALVLMQQPCDLHSAERIEVQSLTKGTLVSSFTRFTAKSA